jgi:hypothetical protein
VNMSADRKFHVRIFVKKFYNTPRINMNPGARYLPIAAALVIAIKEGSRAENGDV